MKKGLKKLIQSQKKDRKNYIKPQILEPRLRIHCDKKGVVSIRISMARKMKEQHLSIKQISQILNCSTRTIYSYLPY